MKKLFNAIRFIISVPLEVLKIPLMHILYWVSIIFALGFFAIGGILLVQYDEKLIMPLIYSSCISSGSIIIRASFLRFVTWLNPYYKWQADKEEESYYDQEYRLDAYKNQRRAEETGFDAMEAQHETYLMVKNFHELAQNKNRTNYIEDKEETRYLQ